MSRTLVALLHMIPSLLFGGGPNAPDSVTAFVNVSVVPMDHQRVLTGQTVIVRGGRIRAMGPTGRVRVPAGATQIDGQGKFLIPGLADMHVHLDSAAADAEYQLLKYLGLGITTVRNMAGSPAHLKLRARAARGEILGPRIYTASPLIVDAALPTPSAAKALVAEYKAAGYDFLKLYPNAGVTRETFDSFVAATEREKIRFAGHSPPPPLGIDDMLRGHAASVEHLTGYMYPAVSLPFPEAVLNPSLPHIEKAKMPAIAAATRRAGVWNCPTAGLYMGMTNDPNLLELFPAMIKALSDSGAGLLLGTDDGTLGLELDINEELQTLVDAGLTPYQALAAGTRNVAEFFGVLNRTGTIAAGKQADLVLLAGNPLQDIRRIEHPAGVMLHGHWLPRDVLDARIAAAKKIAEAGEAASAGQVHDSTTP